MKYFIEHHYWIGAIHVWIEYENNDLSATLSSDLRVLNVTDGLRRSVEIGLPCGVKPETMTVVQKGNLWNIRINTSMNYTGFDRASNHIMEKIVAKWMRRDLVRSKFAFYCSSTGTLLFSSENCLRVRDTPSEFWAEFMDYWHCHKPETTPHPHLNKLSADRGDAHSHSHSHSHSSHEDEHNHGHSHGHSHDHSHTEKHNHSSEQSDALLHRYTNPLVPSVGEIMLSDSFIFLHKDWLPDKFTYDGDVVKLRPDGKVIGSLTKDSAVRIGKWNLKAEIDGKSETVDLSDFVLYQIVNDLKAHSTRMFYLTDLEGNRFTLWVFGIGSSIGFDGGSMMNNCLKILYKEGEPSEEVTNQNMEELEIDEPNALAAFIGRLDAIHERLLESFNYINEWKVSYVSCQ